MARLKSVVVAALAAPLVFGCDYNETLGVKYANLAGAAYCRADSLRSWSCGPKCLPEVVTARTCQGHTTQAFVAVAAGECIASFEGTNGAGSAEVDLTTDHATLHGHTVHNGFLGEWQSLKSCITDSLSDLGCQRRPIGVTGHSLGGAVAALAAFDLAQEGSWHIASVYTFGMPRVGYAGFANAFGSMLNGSFFRVTHGADPFVHMPSGPWYTHLEPEVFYPEGLSGGYKVCWTDGDERCSGRYNFLQAMLKWQTGLHHVYLDVDTTQAGCAGPSNLSCADDIPDSWCVYGIPCNQDVRGPSFCNRLPSSWIGFGRCHCAEGLCPVDGKCRKPNEQLSVDDDNARTAFAKLSGMLAALLAAILSCHCCCHCMHCVAYPRPRQLEGNYACDPTERLLSA